jgi:hypothetical protein
VYVWNFGAIDLESPLGTAANDANAYRPLDLRDAEDSDRHTGTVRLSWQASPTLQAFAGYEVDSFASRNFRIEGMTAVPTTPAGAYAGAYLLNLAHPNAIVHIGYVGLTVRP